ncbi:MAG: CvpA family protein [Chitinophagaceae bacterium]|nr:CvpA family protein [Chitinophagaceae bacterium]MCW5904109.1 CvpA family protein [Chitinophagaceae bacterium]
MIIDSIFSLLLVLAIIKGFKRGFVVAVFSTLAVLIGLVAAVKLSAVTANYLQEKVNISITWLPFLSFAIVMFVTILLVRLIANIIEKTVELALMDWINKLAGIALYIILYSTVFSVLLFYVAEMKLISSETIQASKTYNFIQPLGPKAINSIGFIIPVFKNLFHQLETFFSAIATNTN